MNLEELKHLSIVIVTHYFAEGPAQALEGFLIPRVKRLVVVGHPFPFAKEINSFLREYEEGKLVNKKRAIGWRLPELLLYFKDVFYTLFWLAFRGEKFDLFIGADNLNAFTGLLLRGFGRVGKVVFYTVDYVPKRFENRLLNYIYHKVDKVAVTRADHTWNLSPRMAEGRKEKGIDPRETRQVVVPLGVHYDRIKRLPIEAINPSKIVFMGHLIEKQGVQLVLDALPEVKKRCPSVKFLIIGTGPYEDVLRKKVDELGLQSTVEFTGFIDDHKEVEEKLASCAVAVAPYNPKIDRFTYYADPGKLKNYLAAGLPVILTDVSYVTKELEGNRCGVVIGYSKEEMAEAITELLTDTSRLKECREAAAKYAAQFDWEKIFVETFDGLIL